MYDIQTDQWAVKQFGCVHMNHNNTDKLPPVPPYKNYVLGYGDSEAEAFEYAFEEAQRNDCPFIYELGEWIDWFTTEDKRYQVANEFGGMVEASDCKCICGIYWR